VRAARSTRPLKWDIAGALLVLAALGCKNTFAAIVPAQLLLRVAPDGRDLRQAWRRHGRRALLLASTLLLPAGHFALYKASWHAGQYVTGAPPPSQLVPMMRGIAKEAALLILPVALSILALLAWGRARLREVDAGSPTRLRAAAAEGFGPLWEQYRGACLAGALLLIAGIAIYLPVRVHNPGGRYAIPAAWGGDLWVAALLSTLLEARAGIWKTAAYGAVALGIGGLVVTNVAQQARFAARARCLWQALEFVEHQGAADSCIGWLYGPDLARGEGVHFTWHLRARGKAVRTALIDAGAGRLDDDGRLRDLGEGAICHHPNILFSGSPAIAPGFDFTLMRVIQTPYWHGTRRFDCYVWQPRTARAPASGARRRKAGRLVQARVSSVRS
jgi:hypothetical protein